MKNLFYLLLAVTIFGCNQPKKIKTNTKTKTHTKGRHERLLALYDNVAIDTLHVYSPEDTTSPYYGRPIDSLSATLLPADIAQQHHWDMPGLFAVYKFVIDSNRLGLLTRTPSEYESSSIKLLFYDIARDSITSYIEVGQVIGDEGDFMTVYSWLFRDQQQRLLTLINIMQGHDNSVDDPNDTTVNEHHYYTLLDLSKPRIDTFFQDNEELPAQYKPLIKTKRRKGL